MMFGYDPVSNSAYSILTADSVPKSVTGLYMSPRAIPIPFQHALMLMIFPSESVVSVAFLSNLNFLPFGSGCNSTI